jgi:GT2 family glycosyltransferase
MAYTPEIAVILVNWNGYSYTQACLTSLEQVTAPVFQVILVDNASTAREGLKLKEEFPHLHLIENTENGGFTGGNNVGLRYAIEQGFKQFLLLNNDTIVTPSFLREMETILAKHPGCGAVQPLIMFLHDPTKIWSAGGKWNSFLGYAKTLGDRAPISTFRMDSSNLDWVTGCCILLSKEALTAAGLLDEQYFAYHEDVEWSIRIRNAGYSLKLAPKAVIYHEAGAASKKKHAEGTLSATVFYYHVRNQFYLLRQLRLFAAIPYHGLRFMGWAVYFLLKGRRAKLAAVVRGSKEGLLRPLNPQIK